jgi:hypothetical protein
MSASGVCLSLIMGAPRGNEPHVPFLVSLCQICYRNTVSIY